MNQHHTLHDDPIPAAAAAAGASPEIAQQHPDVAFWIGQHHAARTLYDASEGTSYEVLRETIEASCVRALHELQGALRAAETRSAPAAGADTGEPRDFGPARADRLTRARKMLLWLELAQTSMAQADLGVPCKDAEDGLCLFLGLIGDDLQAADSDFHGYS